MCGKSLSCGGGFFLFGDGTGRYALEGGSRKMRGGNTGASAAGVGWGPEKLAGEC